MRRHIKIEGLLVTFLIAAGMIGASSAFAKCPNMPRVEQVTFKNSEPIVVDHKANKAEPPTTLKGFDGTLIQWKSPKAGEVTKNWPLAYVKGTEVLVEEIKLAVEPEAKKFFESEAEEPPKPTLTGSTTIKGEKVTFTREFTLAEIKTQLGEHEKYLTTGLLKTSKVLPKEVFFEKIKIKWKWTVKEKGGATIEPSAGESTHNLYVMNEKPLANTTIFLTLLDLDTLGIEKEKQPPSEEGVISGVWKGFSTVEAGVPRVHIRVYQPEGAEPAVNRTGEVLRYYKTFNAGKTLAELLTEEGTIRTSCPGRPTAESLLENLEGRCGTWAYTFKEALATEGVDSEVVGLIVKFGTECVPNIARFIIPCTMLVKNWTFGAGTGGELPYATNEVTDGNGVAGQGVANPVASFWDHAIVKAGPNKGASLYDPSYGSGPFSGKEGLAEGEKPSVESVLKEYQKKSIEGFCAPAKGELEAFEGKSEKEREEAEKEEKNLPPPSRCQKAPAAVQLTTTGAFTFP
jgi:hypothetical protein